MASAPIHRAYEVAMPALEAGNETTRHKVMIGGGGPVGLALSLALARYGIPSVVIEADRGIWKESRAICLSRRTLEILDCLGVVKPFLENGLGWTAGRSFYQNSEILRFEMSHDSDQRLLPMTNLQQFYIEQFLADEVARHPDLIELRWGTSLDRVERHKDHVEVDLVCNGSAYRSGCDWLIACDGARSRVRQELGLRMNGTAYEGRYVIVDIEIDLDFPTERLAWFDPPSNPGRTMLMHRQPDGIWRLDYQLHDGEDADEMIRPDNVVPRVKAHLAMLGIDKPWRLLWTSSYRAFALSLDDYAHGRVLFAGDAAHLVPIFGVRGLNSGFDDVFNLAWKLAYVMTGAAPANLLQSFSHERHFAWRTNITNAMKSTEFMAPPSKGFRLMRDAVLSLAGEHPALRSLINPRQSSVIDYSDSDLSTFTGDEASFAGGPKPGEVLPECPLIDATGNATFLTHQLGKDFNLIVFAGTDITPLAEISAKLVQAQRSYPLKMIHILPSGADAAACRELESVLMDEKARFAKLFDASPRAIYLVRPDGHVCARWRTGDFNALTAAIDRALGQPPGVADRASKEMARAS